MREPIERNLMVDTRPNEVLKLAFACPRLSGDGRHRIRANSSCAELVRQGLKLRRRWNCETDKQLLHLCTAHHLLNTALATHRRPIS
jgi:hypothetical protein